MVRVWYVSIQNPCWSLIRKSSYILRRPQNFAKSSPYFWLALHRTRVRWRFLKDLWPFQNLWTLSLRIFITYFLANRKCVIFNRANSAVTLQYSLLSGDWKVLPLRSRRLQNCVKALMYFVSMVIEFLQSRSDLKKMNYFYFCSFFGDFCLKVFSPTTEYYKLQKSQSASKT